MAPLPQNNTARLFLDYTSLGLEHTLILRVGETAPQSQVVDLATDVATVMSTRMLQTDSVFGARYSPIGTNFSIPLPFDPVLGLLTLAGNIWGLDPESVQLSITGRSFVTGRDVKWLFFFPTSTAAWPPDNRYNAGEDLAITTFQANFQICVEGGSTAGLPILAIDGAVPNVNDYVNIRNNSYWQTAQR